MKPSFCTKIASYLMDIPLEKKQSQFSGTLEVLQRKGRIALCSENAVYSYEDLYVNFRDSFAQIDLDNLAIKEVLVLGVGLGSIPLLLEQKFNKKYNYTLVEIDPVIVEMAKKYTLANLDSTTTIHCQDALAFVGDSKQKFDLIAIDIFIDDQTPSAFETGAFLELVQSMLNEKGVLMYNRLVYSQELKIKTLKFYQNTFNQVFTKSCVIDLNGNKMLLNRNCLK